MGVLALNSCHSGSKQHGSSVVSTLALQRRGPGFDSKQGLCLRVVYIFSASFLSNLNKILIAKLTLVHASDLIFIYTIQQLQ